MEHDLRRGFALEYATFDLLTFRLFGLPIAFRERGRSPVLAASFLHPDEPGAADLERHLGLLDWEPPNARLGRSEFSRAWLDAGDPGFLDPLADERPLDAHGRAAHVALLRWRGSGGFGLYEADSPHDTLPDGEEVGPLGRAGYWGGSPARLVWLGETGGDLRLALALVHRADLARWGCALTADALLPPPPGTSRPDGPPPDPIDELLAAREAGAPWPPGGELRAVVGGRWSGTATVPCALCGAPTDLARFGRGHLHLCTDCRPFAEASRQTWLEREARTLLATDPATASLEDRGDLTELAAVLARRGE